MKIIQIMCDRYGYLYGLSNTGLLYRWIKGYHYIDGKIQDQGWELMEDFLNKK